MKPKNEVDRLSLLVDRPPNDILSDHDIEIRHYRITLTQTFLYIFFALLAVWLVVEVVLFVWLDSRNALPFAIDLAAIVLLTAAGVTIFRLIRRGRIQQAALILSSLLCLLTFISTFLFPEKITLLSVGYLVSILIAGGVLGGKGGNTLAAISIGALSIAWLRAYTLLKNTEAPFIWTGGLIFLGGQAIVYFGLARMLHSLSSHIRQTIDRLSTQTKQLTHLALTDPLTGLANRRYLLEQLEREFLRARRYNRPLSLVYIDMDGFKAVNDRFGHIFGDEILSGAALALRGVLRSTDLLARIGGDEFAVLLPETTVPGANGVINKLRKALSAFSKQLGPSVPELTFCAGVAQLREDDETGEALLARADDAQCRAKDAGTGQTRTQLEFDQLPLFENPQRPPRRR